MTLPWGGGGGGGGWPLEVLPISVWGPTSRGAAPSLAIPDEVRRDRFGAVGSEDSLLSHAELAVGGNFLHPSIFQSQEGGRPVC